LEKSNPVSEMIFDFGGQMSYLSDQDLRLCGAGFDPLMHIKDCPTCGSDRQIIGFIEPNTLDVTYTNEYCRWYGTKQILFAYPKAKEYNLENSGYRHKPQIEEV
jgi:hypothetical protein